MWLIVGLGNPGKDYANTRHNLGFMVIDEMSSKWSITLSGKSRNFVYGKGSVEGRDIALIKPLTFMNRSGIAVRDALMKFQDIKDILVVHDDLDLDFGAIRIRKNGSAGGHRGIESIIEITGTKEFLRLKIGIGRSQRIPPEEYVLRRFDKEERTLLKDTIDKAACAIDDMVHQGISHAQNKFHRA